MRGGRSIAVGIGLLFLVAFAVVFWATWSALPHHAAAAPAAGKQLPVEVVALICWIVTGAYGVTVATTGRQFATVPRGLTGFSARAWGAAEAILAVLAAWAILTQPADSFFFTFAVGLGVFGLGTSVALVLRPRFG